MDCSLWPTFSIVMPFYNNARTLLACISSFTRQSQVQAQEIIIVDDGEQPQALAIVQSQTWPLPVRVLRTVRKGQSAATNAGIRAATSDIIMLTCADTVATPHLCAEHLKAHKQELGVGVLGPIEYAPWVPKTPIMAYLAQPKVQFDFASIDDTENVPGRLLYAPNASVSRARLMQAGLFDESLTYGYQDCDLGLKLQALGLRFVYRDKALVWHDHPNTVQGFIDRQVRVNTLWATMARRYPHLADLHNFTQQLDHYVPMLPMLGPLQKLAEKANDTLAVRFSEARPSECELTRLFALFGTLGNIAMMSGIVADLPALGDVLELDNRPWMLAQRASA